MELSFYARAAIGLLPGRRPDRLPERSLTRTGVRVDRAHLAAYDRVCGFRLTDTLPATYPHVPAFAAAMDLMADRAFPFPVVGLVHIANRIELRRPIDADEPLDLTVHAVDLREHPRGRQFDIEATATVAGETVWRSRSTYLRRERSSSERRDRTGEPPAASALWRVTPRVGTDYAAVSGDHNPIHTSALGARAFGFARPIAHGMWSKARCLAALEGRLPDAYAVEVAFKTPIALPGRVAFSSDLRSFALHEARSGRPHLTGEITPG